MMATSWKQLAQERPVADEPPLPALCRKIVLIAPSDADVVTRLRPMLDVLRGCAQRIVVIGRATGRHAELQALGVHFIEFDDRISLAKPAQKAASIWRLARFLEEQGADVVHLCGGRAILLGSLVARLGRVPRMMMHISGPGMLGIAQGPLAQFARSSALRLAASALSWPSASLLVDTASDLTTLRGLGVDPGPRFAILGGMGVDPQAFPPLPPPNNRHPVAAFTGPITRGNGVDLLFQACDRVAGRGVRLSLELRGPCEGPDAIDMDVLRSGCDRSGGRWHSSMDDMVGMWRRADICVLPSRQGGGMPRALLEAAACARPLVVTDVPGARDFVRQGVEGFIVPAGDPAALADALLHLSRDADLRERMGEAARLRLLHGHTNVHLREAVRGAYQSLLTRTPAVR